MEIHHERKTNKKKQERKRKNTITNVENDSEANIDTRHIPLIADMRIKLKSNRGEKENKRS